MAWHRVAMTSPTPNAGGFFLIAAILIGFGVGVSLGQPVAGALAGTLVGAAIAVAIWLVDRRRTGR